ncbi:class I SAM-dependent methyltransferase [Spirosoma luteum]|uniref:class I SAM-dependent methyltransferase n=1 Tax=Spirosoma luteum TaxID=431553 RepID=UPI00047789EA|nr:class I SAM-dependent methyltransferase [Spirosoma luteum]
MEAVTECPICDNVEFKSYLTCRDYLVSNEKFIIQECISCGFRLTNPRPDDKSIGNYYKSENYVSHNDESGGFINVIYRTVRSYTLSSKTRLIKKINGGEGKLLDVGCGTGSFLEACKSSGWQIAGVETDSTVKALAQEKLKIQVHQDLSEIPNKESFNVITLWHVLEHIPNLNDAVRRLSMMLAPNGTLIIAVPNSNSYDANYFKEYWAAYDVPRHLYHFTPSTIEKLINKYKLQVIETKPMVFDAFYIAMLSTRYQTGKTNYIESLKVGLRSNAKARKTGDSSSLIYIVKKL